MVPGLRCVRESGPGESDDLGGGLPLPSQSGLGDRRDPHAVRVSDVNAGVAGGVVLCLGAGVAPLESALTVT